MRRIAGIAVAVAAFAGAAPAGAAPLHVATSLTPRWLFFADSVTAHVDVTFDPRVVRADSVQIETALAPWDAVGTTRVSTPSAGHRSWRFVVACLSVDCLPRGTVAQRFHLPAVRVVAQTRTGRRISVRTPWPTLKVAGRFLPATTVGLRPVFRVDAAVPAATYRADPSTLFLVLLICGGLLVAAGVGLGVVEALRYRAARRVPPVTPALALALELLREAQRREPDDRRRAAGLVARTLPPETDGLASTAAEIAWSPREPAADRLGELARAVEERLEGSK